MREEVRQSIIAIADKNGGTIDPRELFVAAQDKNHPAHDEFEWDVRKAAEVHNIAIARKLIRQVRIEVTVTEFKLPKRIPVFAPAPDSPVYETINSLRADRDRARETAINELSTACRQLRRASVIAVELGFDPLQVEDVIAKLTGLQQQLAREARNGIRH